MSCSDSRCGVPGWSGPLPGDPDNGITLTAVGGYGGNNIYWTYPVTNGYAVSYAILWRGTTPVFADAAERQRTTSNSIYDAADSNILYYYWIQIVSIHSTVNDPIGPVSATALPYIEQIIADLSGKISQGMLATFLNDEINKITLHKDELDNEILNRISGNEELSQALIDVMNGLQESLAFVAEEIIHRQDGDEALLIQLNTIAAVNQDNTAAILEERLARVTADAALALVDEQLHAANDDNAAATQDIRSARIGYSAEVNTDFAYDGDNSTIVYPAAQFPAATFPYYAVNRTRIIDKVGVDRWNALSVGTTRPLKWVVGMPLAYAVKRVQVAGANGGLATVEQNMTAQLGLNGQFKALYGAKVNVNGLIGGFGIYNNGTVVEAGFDVDNFWIGRTQGNKVLPFIIQGGVTYINNAMINQLTADRIDSRGLTIKDAAGNIIFGAGNNLAVSRITGLGSLATQSSVSTSQVTGLGALATKNFTSLGDATVRFPNGDTVGVNDLVTRLSKISSANISSFMDVAAIGSAYIGNAAIKNAHIENLSVDNLKIAGSAVSTGKIAGNAVSQAYSGNGNNSVTLSGINIPSGESYAVLVFANYLGSSVVINTLGGADSNRRECRINFSGTSISVATNAAKPFSSSGASWYFTENVSYSIQDIVSAGNYSITASAVYSGGGEAYYNTPINLIVLLFKR